MLSQEEIRKKLLDILEGPPKMTQVALAGKIGIGPVRLNQFLRGRDHADRQTERTTIGGEGLRKLLKYLRTEHAWPPPFDAKEALKRLASVATREKPRSLREGFALKLREGFIVTSITRREIEAEDADYSTARYRPKGGLRQEDLDSLRPFLEPEQVEEFMELLAGIEA